MQLFRSALVAFLLPGAACATSVEIVQCHQLKDSTQRLACYDAIEDTTTPAPISTKQDSFGLPTKSREDAADAVETNLLKNLDGWRPNEIVELANGQIWQVTDGSSSVMRPKKPKVKIRRGAFGAFYMEFDGINQAPRVKRIR